MGLLLLKIWLRLLLCPLFSRPSAGRSTPSVGFVCSSFMSEKCGSSPAQCVKWLVITCCESRIKKWNPLYTCDSSKPTSTGERGGRRGERRGEGADSSGARRGFSVPSSSLSCSSVLLCGRSAAVSTSSGLSRMRDAIGGGTNGVGWRGSGRGGPGAGVVPSTGSGGGRGEEVRDKGELVLERVSGEQGWGGGVGVEVREMEGGGERLLRRPHCSRFSLVVMVGAT